MPESDVAVIRLYAIVVDPDCVSCWNQATPIGPVRDGVADDPCVPEAQRDPVRAEAPDRVPDEAQRRSLRVYAVLPVGDRRVLAGVEDRVADEREVVPLHDHARVARALDQVVADRPPGVVRVRGVDPDAYVAQRAVLDHDPGRAAPRGARLDRREVAGRGPRVDLEAVEGEVALLGEPDPARDVRLAAAERAECDRRRRGPGLAGHESARVGRATLEENGVTGLQGGIRDLAHGAPGAGGGEPAQQESLPLGLT